MEMNYLKFVILETESVETIFSSKFVSGKWILKSIFNFVQNLQIRRLQSKNS